MQYEHVPAHAHAFYFVFFLWHKVNSDWNYLDLSRTSAVWMHLCLKYECNILGIKVWTSVMCCKRGETACFLAMSLSCQYLWSCDWLCTWMYTNTNLCWCLWVFVCITFVSEVKSRHSPLLKRGISCIPLCVYQTEPIFIWVFTAV